MGLLGQLGIWGASRLGGELGVHRRDGGKVVSTGVIRGWVGGQAVFMGGIGGVG